jgi:hypothetical protein
VARARHRGPVSGGRERDERTTTGATPADTLPDNPQVFDSSTRGPSGARIAGPMFRVVPMKGLSYP